MAKRSGYRFVNLITALPLHGPVYYLDNAQATTFLKLFIPNTMTHSQQSRTISCKSAFFFTGQPHIIDER